MSVGSAFAVRTQPTITITTAETAGSAFIVLPGSGSLRA